VAPSAENPGELVDQVLHVLEADRKADHALARPAAVILEMPRRKAERVFLKLGGRNEVDEALAFAERDRFDLSN
jgi:hypothetical protein